MSRSGRHSNLFKHNIIEDNKNEVAITSKRIAEDLEQPRPCKRTRSEQLLNTSIETLDSLSQCSDSFSNLTSDFSSPGSFTTFNYNFVDNQVIYQAPVPDPSQATVQENNFSSLNLIESEFRDLNFIENEFCSINYSSTDAYLSFDNANPVAEIEASNQLTDIDLNLLDQFFTEFDFQLD